MDRGATVIVAGAGVLGLSTALALADAGCAVTVCDPAAEAANASGVAAGMLAPAFETVLDADGPDDLPLLLAVGQPVVVNPDPRLAREARRRGWPVQRW